MAYVLKHKYRELSAEQVEELGPEAMTVVPPRQLRVLSDEELSHLNETRLLSYRKKALSLENSHADSDYHDEDPQDWDPEYIYFKDDPRWKVAYESILATLSKSQGSDTTAT